jgi:hypothetical protein
MQVDSTALDEGLRQLGGEASTLVFGNAVCVFFHLLSWISILIIVWSRCSKRSERPKYGHST